MTREKLTKLFLIDPVFKCYLKLRFKNNAETDKWFSKWLQISFEKQRSLLFGYKVNLEKPGLYRLKVKLLTLKP